MPTRRDDPNANRQKQLSVGSEDEIGHELTKVLQQEGDGYRPVYDEGSFWEYKKASGLWTRIEETELHCIVGTFDGSKYKPNPNSTQVKLLQVSHRFSQGAIARAACHVAEKDFFKSAAPVLAFADCALKITPDGPVKVPMSPENRARVGYGFPYDPNAEAPRFKQMLSEHFEGDEDAADKIACEQEFFGGSLLGLATKYQKCLLLLSGGGSGRSTLMKIIEQVFPANTICHVPPDQMTSERMRIKLMGMLLNFSDEMPGDAFMETEDFKKIVTGDPVDGCFKYKDSIEFRSRAGNLFLINDGKIALGDLSAAFFRRFLLIRYKRRFDNSPSRDYDLADKIIASELPGVLNWILEGAVRLLKQNGYTIPASHAAEERRMRMSDPVARFLDSEMVCATFKEAVKRRLPNGKWQEHDWIGKQDLWDAFTEWAHANKHRPMSSALFYQRIEEVYGFAPARRREGIFYPLNTRLRAETKESRAAQAEGREPRPLLSPFAAPKNKASGDSEKGKVLIFPNKPTRV